MATFSKVNFKSLNYNTFRPHYPALFYKILSDYAIGKDPSKLPIGKSVDLGCGTGVATYPLLNISEKVIGLDLSANMIKTANLLKQERCKEMGVESNRIEFITGSVESLVTKGESSIFGKGDVDLISAAQCIHWFQDYPKFFEASAKLLKSGGTLAYWFYIDPIVVDYSGSENDTKEVKISKLHRSREIIDKYLYDDPNFAGPHWEQPGRNILREYLEEVNKNIPRDLFEDIQINQFHADVENAPFPGQNDLDIVNHKLPVSAVGDYIGTNSGYHNYKEVNGEKAIDIPNQILKEWETELGWDKETTVEFVYNTGYTFMKRKQ